MQGQLLELSDAVEGRGHELLKNYEPDDLHAFRVNIRRIRSILKQMDNPRARRYRKVWGGFAAVSNLARDWDVFMKWASSALSPGEFEEFRRINRDRLESSHEAVLEILRSAHWQRHLREWRQLLLRSDEIPADQSGHASSLEQALEKARTTLNSALLIGDDRAWHKFRIAVKDVRYVADALPGDPEPGSEHAMLIDRCKKLQTALGNWHDTVVQLNLLEELEPVPAHARLSELISSRQEQLLSQIRTMLADDPIFYPKPSVPDEA